MSNFEVRLTELIDLDLARYDELKVRRELIVRIGKQRLEETGRKFIYLKHTDPVVYLGPNIDNEKTIYCIGNPARVAGEQMVRDGVRSRQRKARSSKYMKGKDMDA